MRALSSSNRGQAGFHARPNSLFTFVLIKPTHYDDDGYPIQWFRSALPSNTLACMNSLAEDASKREVLGPGVEDRGRHLRRDQSPRVPEPDHPRPQAPGRAGADRHRRGAVEPISARCGYRASVSRGRLSGLPRRLPRLGLPCHAARASVGDRRGAGARHFDVRRRSRRASARRSAARRLEQRAEAALQFHGQAAVARWRAGADPAAQACRAHRRAPIRASISAAAAPISARSARSSTCRGARAASARPTISNRSSAPITTQGIDRFFITDDNFARNSDWEILLDRVIELEEGRHPRRLHHPGRHALPQDSELHREGDAGRRQARVHRA